MKNNWIALLVAVFMIPIVSCKKTDKLAEQVNNQPFLITTDFGLVPWHLPNYSYQRSYLVGDTATFLGKFFPDKPGFQILIGKAAAQIVFKTQVPTTGDSALNQYTHQLDKLDYVRFVITPAMGTGNNVPVTISANGMTIQGPSLSILEFQGGSRKMDSTLYVDSLTNWLPANLALYQTNNIPLLSGQSVTRDGTICFNDLTDIFLLSNRTISRITGSGNIFQENGSSFTINKVLGSVIALAGDSLAFSAEVLENIPDTATSFIFRLCKMDLASGTVRTINRTLWQKGVATVNAPLGPTQGAATSLSLIASNLKTDLSGSIYFINCYGPPNTNMDVTATYNGGIGFLAEGSIFFNFTLLGNICRVDASGKLKSIIAASSPQNSSIAPPYILPGYPSPYLWNVADYLVSQDGSNGFVINSFDLNNFYRMSFVLLDLNLGAPLLVTDLGAFLPANNPNPNYLSFNNLQFLPDGELLYNNSNNGNIESHYLPGKTFYTYAGVQGPKQIQTTGPAINVLFNAINFAGLDKTGGVYYYTGLEDYVNGVSFYKLYPKH